MQWLNYLAEVHNCGAPSTRFPGSIAERGDKRGSGENGTDDLALHSDAAAVDDAEGPVSETVGFVEVLFDYRLDVPGRDAVEIEDIGDGNSDGFLVHGF